MTNLDKRAAEGLRWSVVNLILDKKADHPIYLWDGYNVIAQFPGGGAFYFSPTTNRIHAAMLVERVEEKNMIQAYINELCYLIDPEVSNPPMWEKLWMIHTATPAQITEAAVRVLEASDG